MPKPRNMTHKQDTLTKRRAYDEQRLSHGANSLIDPTLFNAKAEPGCDLTLPSTPKVRLGKKDFTGCLAEKQTTSPIELYRSYSYPSPHAHDHPRSLTNRMPIYNEEFNRDVGYFGNPVGGSADRMSDQQCDAEKSDMTKLKGVIWPGMSLFDAASPEARRMRNQKKDTSVLAIMRANSQMVEPTEVIYFPSWEVKKERFISGDVESSPPPVEAPRKRKKIVKCSVPRTPLTELDPNTLAMEGGFGAQNHSRNRVRGVTGDSSKHAEPGLGNSSKIHVPDEKHLFNPADRGIVSWKRTSNANSGNIHHGMDVFYNGMDNKETQSTQLPSHSANYSPFCFPPLWGSQRPSDMRHDGIPGLWATGPHFKHNMQHSIDANAEKENIAPGFSTQHEQTACGIPNSSWPNRRQHWPGEKGRVQLQCQMPPSADLVASDTISRRADLGFAFANPLGQLSYTRNQQGRMWALTPKHSRPIKEHPYPCEVPNVNFESVIEEDFAASSGDETIDQRIDELSYPQQI
ncbi:hypothetical protein MMC10_007268 [Thelotrema lepadinum]|nr:hypothetical protein [Thelotrema lepadinum]